MNELLCFIYVSACVIYVSGKIGYHSMLALLDYAFKDKHQ
jgi:hypothetical protein